MKRLLGWIAASLTALSLILVGCVGVASASSRTKSMTLRNTYCSATLRDIPESTHIVTSGKYEDLLAYDGEYIGLNCRAGNGSFRQMDTDVSLSPRYTPSHDTRNVYSIAYTSEVENEKKYASKVVMLFARVHGGLIEVVQSGTRPNKNLVVLLSHLDANVKRGASYAHAFQSGLPAI